MYTATILLTVTATVLGLATSFLLWQYRTVASTRPLLVAAVLLAFWALAYLFQLQADDPAQLRFWHVLQQPAALFIDVLLLLFALEVSGRRGGAALLFVPTIATALVLTNSGGLLWDSRVIAVPDHVHLLVQPGVLLQLYLGFQTAALAAALFLLVRSTSTWQRRLLVAVGGLLPLGVRLATVYGQAAWDLTPVAFAVLLLVIVVAVLEINLFSALPEGYLAVVQNNPDGVLILDSRRRVLLANGMFSTLTGIDALAVQGRPLLAAVPAAATWLPALAPREATSRDVALGRRFLEVRAIPLLGRGAMRGWALLLRDMTAQQKAQDALRESETRYRTLFDQAQDAILLEDSRLAIVDANDAAVRLLGYSLAELKTMTSEVIQPQALRYETPDVKSGRFEMQAIRKDRSALDLEVTVAPIPDGERLLYMSILRDVTERKRAQAELRQRADELAQLYEQVSRLEQYKTEMIRMAAHDLRQPISVTLGHSDLLLREGDRLSAQQRDHIEAIRRAVGRANHILSDILSLERIEQQMSRGFAERFNFHGLLGDMIAQYRDQAADRRQHLIVDVDADDTLYEVMGHSPQVSEAVANLIENAVKYTPPEGTITIHLRNNGSHLIFEVRDTGYGIPQDMQELLFRPFSRARSAETLHIEGTGLGLHLVKSIVERHGGSIIFRSIYREGSTFGFRLPLDRKDMVIPRQAVARDFSAVVVADRPLLPPVD